LLCRYETLPPAVRLLNIPFMRIDDPFTRINDPFTRINDPFTRINDPFTRINDPFTCINDPFTRINDPFTRINDPFTRINDPFTRINDPFTRINDPFTRVNNPHQHRYILQKRISVPRTGTGSSRPVGSGRTRTVCASAYQAYGVACCVAALLESINWSIYLKMLLL
jgi:hypothetical protein